MIVCPRCSKENQDHYKFCLGCGAELPRNQAAPKEFAPTPPPAAPPVGAAPSVQPIPKDKNLQFAATQQGDAMDIARATAAAPRGSGASPSVAEQPPPPAAQNAAQNASPAASKVEMRECPSCGGQVPQDFKFCGSCGHRMDTDGASASKPAPAPAPSAPAPATASAVGKLVLINPDGSEGESHSLADSAVIGRTAGGLFAADSYLSPKHATFTFEGGSCVVRDEGSLNGVYYKIPRDQPITLEHGTIFRIGQEIVVFEEVAGADLNDTNGVQPMGSPNPGYLGRISLVIGRESRGNGFVIPPEGMHIGRERGDVIFPEDGYVSGLHCRIHSDGKRVCLTDVGSSNGTFVRIQGEKQCPSGELLLMGQQLFRLAY